MIFSHSTYNLSNIYSHVEIYVFIIYFLLSIALVATWVMSLGVAESGSLWMKGGL